MLYELIRTILVRLGGVITLTRFMGIEKVDARRLLVFGLLVALVIAFIVWSLVRSVALGA